MPERDDVRDAVAALRDRGETFIVARDVAAELDVEADHGTLTSIGHYMRGLVDEGVVAVHSTGGDAYTYRIDDADVDPETVRGAVRRLRTDGRTLISSVDVAEALDLPDSRSTLSRIGYELGGLVEDGVIERVSTGSRRVTYRIPEPDSGADQPVATDGGEIEPPEVDVGDRVTLCAMHDGENEYVHGVVNEVHSPKCIDVLYRVESRRSNSGEGRFRRDSHTDTYEFATSCVYMADVNGWLKGWDDA
jgi:hypothetical protein